MRPAVAPPVLGLTLAVAAPTTWALTRPEATAGAPKWHDDVRFFTVHDDADAASVRGADAKPRGLQGDGAQIAAFYLDPYAPCVHLLLGRTHRARGEWEKAESELRMALWSTGDPAARLELAAVLKEMGRKSEARVEAGKVLEGDPKNAAARRLLEAP